MNKPGSKGKVLVVDDLQSAVVLIGGMLSEFGFDVVSAENGQKAVDRVKELMAKGGKFEAIFIDIAMPEVNGIEATKQIRALGYPGAILAFSASNAMTTIKLAKAAGVDHFFAKSTFNKELAKALIHKFCKIDV